MGLRANATAMLVPSWMRPVAPAAVASGRNGSWLVSLVQGAVVPGRFELLRP